MPRSEDALKGRSVNGHRASVSVLPEWAEPWTRGFYSDAVKDSAPKGLAAQAGRTVPPEQIKAKQPLEVAQQPPEAAPKVLVPRPKSQRVPSGEMPQHCTTKALLEETQKPDAAKRILRVFDSIRVRMDVAGRAPPGQATRPVESSYGEARDAEWPAGINSCSPIREEPTVNADPLDLGYRTAPPEKSPERFGQPPPREAGWPRDPLVWERSTSAPVVQAFDPFAAAGGFARGQSAQVQGPKPSADAGGNFTRGQSAQAALRRTPQTSSVSNAASSMEAARVYATRSAELGRCLAELTADLQRACVVGVPESTGVKSRSNSRGSTAR